MKFKFKFVPVRNNNPRVDCVSLNNSIQEKNVASYLADIEEDILNEKIDYKYNVKILRNDIYDVKTGTKGWEGDIIADKMYLSFIFSPEDRNSQAEISKKSMLMLLEKWAEFLKKEPDLNYEEIVEIPDDENPTVYSEAYFGTYKTFLEKFEEGQQYEEDLLYTAFCNYVPEEKYKIVKFLLGKGASVKKKKGDGINLFFPLFMNIFLDNKETNLKITLKLCRMLLEKGESLSSVDMNTGETPLNRLFSTYGILYPDKRMVPLYDIVFSQPDLKILLKDKKGETPLDIARKNGRKTGVKYMEEYIEKYGLKEE